LKTSIDGPLYRELQLGSPDDFMLSSSLTDNKKRVKEEKLQNTIKRKDTQKDGQTRPFYYPNFKLL
jgi:hypothetical protein